MIDDLLTPDYIFEASWEVCNKVGGIYTVLSTRANTLQAKFRLICIYSASSSCAPFSTLVL